MTRKRLNALILGIYFGWRPHFGLVGKKAAEA
jgi:hypothetical protein